MIHPIKDKIYLVNEITILIEKHKTYESGVIFTIKDDLCKFHWSINYDFSESTNIELIYYENGQHLIYLNNIQARNSKLRRELMTYAKVNLFTVLESNEIETLWNVI
jgi:hypothetical protein